jgi:hypothetical protein
VHGAGKPLGEFLPPFRISLDNAITIPDRGRDDPIPGDKLGCSAPEIPKLIMPETSGVNCRVQSGAKALTLAADH